MTFNQVVKQIYAKSPLQNKKLESYFASQSPSFFKETDEFNEFYMGQLC
jgi:hypothetical protein